MIRTLHIDIEGGWGGSSRSLYELVSRLPRDRFAPLVVHRQMGPILERYAALGIPTIHVPEIASFAARPRNSWKIFLAVLPRLLGLRRCADRLAAIAADHRPDVLHLNYEGLFLLAPMLRRRLGLPMVCHSRTHIPANRWGRWMVRSLARSVDHMFYITTQESDRFAELTDRAVPGEVLWNIASPAPERHPLSDPPEAVFLGNVTGTKGADRMVDLAAALEEMNAPPLRLVVCGAARQQPDFPKEMQRRIDALGLGHRIEMRGFIKDPYELLRRAFAVIRPSRDNDPWGRDVIEAISAGVPVLATGSYTGVVEPGVNGYLFQPFDARAMAETLVALRGDMALWQRLSDAGRDKGRRVFGGETQVAQASRVFAALAAGQGKKEDQ